MNIADLAVRVTADMKQFEQGMKNMSQSLQDAGKRVSAAGTTMTKGLTLPILAVGGALSKAAMDLEATEAKYNTVFEGMTEDADAFIEKFRELTPATTAQARNMASSMQDLLVPMGIAREEATQMTGEFMHVTGALQAFNSATHTSEDVANAMASALSGQYMPLRSLGIQLDKTTIHQRALEMGLADTKDEITKQIEAQVLLDEVYAQSTDALEAYTAENLDTKTQLGLLKAEVIDQAAQLGQVLLPVIQDQVIPMIQRFVDRLKDLSEWFQSLDPAVQQNIIRFIAVAAALGPVLLAVGKLIALFGMILNPIGLVVVAIAGLIAILVRAWQTNETFRDIVLAVFERVRDFVVAAIEFIRNVIQTVTSAILAWWEAWGDDIISSASQVWDRIWGIISSAVELIGIVIQGAVAAIRFLWNTFGDDLVRVWQFVWDVVGGVVTTALEIIRSTIGGALQVIQGILDVFIGVFTGDWKRAWDGISGIVRGAANVIIGIINAIIGAAERMVNAMGSAINRIPTFSIPSWVPLLGGKSFGIPTIPRVSLPRIPTLHGGTDYFMPPGGGMEGLALLQRGEQVIPRGEAQQARSANILVYLDGREIGRAIGQPLVDEIRVRTGVRI